MTTLPVLAPASLTQGGTISTGETILFAVVAGVVGCLIARILGFSDDRTLEYADKMGLALQLTNIIRDVGEESCEAQSAALSRRRRT